jgi:hypothetical protein
MAALEAVKLRSAETGRVAREGKAPNFFANLMY